MARKVHGQGGTKGRNHRQNIKAMKSSNKTNERLLNKTWHNRRKKRRKAIRIVKRITRPEILKQWARKEGLVARKQLKERKIRQFTYYCKLLAIDALYTKHMPKRALRIKKGVMFRPSTEGTLSRTQKRDLLEKLDGMEINTFNRKELVKRQMEKVNLPALKCGASAVFS